LLAPPAASAEYAAVETAECGSVRALHPFHRNGAKSVCQTPLRSHCVALSRALTPARLRSFNRIRQPCQVSEEICRPDSFQDELNGNRNEDEAYQS